MREKLADQVNWQAARVSNAEGVSVHDAQVEKTIRP